MSYAMIRRVMVYIEAGCPNLDTVTIQYNPITRQVNFTDDQDQNQNEDQDQNQNEDQYQEQNEECSENSSDEYTDKSDDEDADYVSKGRDYYENNHSLEQSADRERFT